MSKHELNNQAAIYFDLLAQIEALQAEAEAIKDSMKAVMIEQATEELEGDGWRATWHNVNNRRFDSKRFKADNPDLYQAYSVSSTGVRFTVNRLSA